MEQKSKLFRIDVRDFVKGLIIAILAGVSPLLMTDLTAEVVHIDWNAMRMVAMGAMGAYLTTNFFTNSKGKPITKEPK